MFTFSKKTIIRDVIVSVAAFLAIAGAVSAATTIGSNISTGGTIQIAPGYSLDTSAAGALNIGTTTATSITIGRAGVTTTFPGTASTTALAVGTSTPYQVSAAASTGTTTVSLYAAAANKGGCIEMTGPANAQYRIYISGSGANLIAEVGACK